MVTAFRECRDSALRMRLQETAAGTSTSRRISADPRSSPSHFVNPLSRVPEIGPCGATRSRSARRTAAFAVRALGVMPKGCNCLPSTLLTANPDHGRPRSGRPLSHVPALVCEHAPPQGTGKRSRDVSEAQVRRIVSQFVATVADPISPIGGDPAVQTAPAECVPSRRHADNISRLI